jgi:flagellar hook-associated protein 2
MAITISGLSSGMDTGGMISSLVAAESVPLTQLQTQKTAIEKAKSDVSSFLGRVSDLASAAKALADPLQFSAAKATSSDSAVVATAGVGATPGTTSIEVQSLARESRAQSLLASSSTDGLGGEGLLTVKVGTDSSAEITVAASDSLADVASKINSAGLRVSASVLYDGSKYRMIVRGLDSGTANAVSFEEAGTLATTLGMTDSNAKLQSATDAKIRLDGSITVTRSSNQISGVIPGVTLALTKETSSPVQLTVAADGDALATKIKSFVTAYNAVVSTSHLTAGYGTTKGSDALLQGDSAFRSTLDTIARAVGGAVAGTGGKSLALAGISSQKDGSLTFDESKLTSLLAKDPTTAKKLFTTDAAIGATGVMGTLAKALESVAGTGGTLQRRIDTYAAQTTRLDQSADALTRRIAAFQEQLQKQFGAMETAFSNAKTQTATLDSIFATTSTSSSSKSG